MNEHRKNIDKVAGIELADFECRALAVQSGYQAAAEDHLIALFEPIWNNQTRILFGLGKHGDSAETRSNKRSPFDTVHPGRAWAERNEDGKSPEQIKLEVAEHFRTATIFKDTGAVFAAFVEGIKRADRLSDGNST